ncbi:hypothetical protein [Paenibacillus sp.]|uniref:hypothetical protein n=1 Tax=Paenibacillus sp. TaxID=58172 RepID=UPI002D24034D|nr:hypothetical protein [Paenibacillus sp.]HZG88460.1 hypothetical protein [Paenibacillus sp.]
MKQVVLQVDSICSCKEKEIVNRFLAIDVVSSIHVGEGTVTVRYDPLVVYFVDILEVVEDSGCTVLNIVRDGIKRESRPPANAISVVV